MLTLILALASYLLALWASCRQKMHLALVLIVLGGILLKLGPALDPWVHEWDERYHALVARNLTQHWLRPTLYEHPVLPYDYRNWTANHIWVHKQPVTLWLIALSLRMFGYSALAVRLPSLLCSSFCAFIVFDIGRRWYRPAVGLWAAFLLSVNGLVLELATGNDNTDHVDVLFLSFVLLSVWLAIRAHERQMLALHLAAGFALGIAILTKWLPALVVVPIWLLLPGNDFRERRGRFLAALILFLAAAACVALPWQLYILHAFPAEARWEYHFNTLHFTQAIEGHSGPWYYHFGHLLTFFGEAAPIPLIWLLYRACCRPDRKSLVLVAWFWLPYLFFTVPASKMPAYPLIAAPAICLTTAVFLDHCAAVIREGARRRAWLVVICVALAVLPLRYCIERLKPWDGRMGDRQRYNAMQVFIGGIKDPQRTVVFGCPAPVELMFYSGCTAYEMREANEVAQRLRQRGYTVMEYPAGR